MTCPRFCLAVYCVLNCPCCHLNDFNFYMHVCCYDWARLGVAITHGITTHFATYTMASDRTCDVSHDQETTGIVTVTKWINYTTMETCLTFSEGELHIFCQCHNTLHKMCNHYNFKFTRIIYYSWLLTTKLKGHQQTSCTIIKKSMPFQCHM